MLPLAIPCLTAALIAFTAGGFIAGWMACAAFQTADDSSDQGA